MNQGITLRMGAAHHDVTAGDTHIDLSSCNREERYTVRRTLIETLKEQGYFGAKEQRKAYFRNKAKRKAA